MADRFHDWTQNEPIKTVYGPIHKTVARMDLYVELIVDEWEKIHTIDLENFDHASLTKTKKLERENIIKLSDRCVLVIGIAGIGKTSLLNSLVYDWSMQKCLNDFELVVKLECRELNVMRHLNSWQDILCRRYPNLFSEMVLKHVAKKKIVIIIDGIDEYAYFDDLKKILNENKIGDSPANALYDLLLAVLPFWHVLICGRPRACEEIGHGLDYLYAKCKRVEVTGFNQEGVSEYIKKFDFTVDNSRTTLQQTLSENLRLESFMCVPAYAHTICSVYDKENTLLEQLNTSTKLNLALFLVHLRDFTKKSNCSLMELCRDPELMGVVQDLAKFAYKSMAEGRIIFEEAEMFQCKYLTGVEKTGIFVKCDYGEDGYVYQFRHLILQELLCAIHIYRNIDFKLVRKQSKMDNAFLMFVGLLGCHQNLDCPKYISSFVLALQSKKYIDDESKSAAILAILQRRCKKRIHEKSFINEIKDIIYEFHNETSLIVNSFLKNNEFKCKVYNKSSFLKVLYIIKHFKVNGMTLLIEEFADFTVQQATELVKAVEFARSNQNNNHNENRTILKPSQQICLKLIDISNRYLEDGVLSALSPMLPSIEGFRFNVHTIITKEWQTLIDSVISSDARKELNLKELYVKIRYDEDLVYLSQIAPFIEKLEIQAISERYHDSDIFEKGWQSLRKYVLDSHCSGVLKLRELDISTCTLDDECFESLSSIFPLLERVALCKDSVTFIFACEIIAQSIIQAHQNGQLKLRGLHLLQCHWIHQDISYLAPVVPLLETFTLYGYFGRCMSCCLKEEDAWGSITQSVINANCNGNLTLKEIYLQGYSITDDDLSVLLPIFPLLQFVDLSGNWDITKDGWKSFTQYIINSHNNGELKLSELVLRKCDLNDDDIVTLSPIFPLMKDICVDLNHNITNNGWKLLSKYYDYNSSINPYPHLGVVKL